MEILKGRGGSRLWNSEGMGGNAFWNFRRQGWVKAWKPSVVGYGYFLELLIKDARHSQSWGGTRSDTSNSKCFEMEQIQGGMNFKRGTVIADH